MPFWLVSVQLPHARFQFYQVSCIGLPGFVEDCGDVCIDLQNKVFEYRATGKITSKRNFNTNYFENIFSTSVHFIFIQFFYVNNLLMFHLYRRVYWFLLRWMTRESWLILSKKKVNHYWNWYQNTLLKYMEFWNDLALEEMKIVYLWIDLNKK
jgi:hypothetical protein